MTTPVLPPLTFENGYGNVVQIGRDNQSLVYGPVNLEAGANMIAGILPAKHLPAGFVATTAAPQSTDSTQPGYTLDGYVITWNGTEYVAAPPAVSSTGAQDGYGLTWNGSQFVPTASSSGGGDYALFFAMMPGDNSATVAVGAAVQFPEDGPTSGVIVGTGSSTFELPAVGTYEVSFQVSVSEPGQLQLAIGGVGLPHTTVGRATGTSQLVCNTIITTSVANSILSVINPVGNSTALTITPIAGGASAVSATLKIKRLA